MINLICYILLSIIKFVFILLYYLFLLFIFQGPILIIGTFLCININFVLKIFLPIYFLLSFNTINYKGYYQINFFGYNVSLWDIYYYKIILFINNIIYNNKYIFLIIFIIIFVLNYFNNKIFFFFFIIIFILLLLFYFYKIFNNIKIYIEKYILYFNLSYILSIIYIIFKLEDDIILFDYNFNDNDNECFTDLIYYMASPRWFYKNAYNHIFPEYTKELYRLNDGLIFYDYYLKDKYLWEHKFLNLNLDCNNFLMRINKNYKNYYNFINSFNLGTIYYIKELYAFDKFNNLINVNYKAQEIIHNKYLFDFNNNKSFNCTVFISNVKLTIDLNYKNIYADAVLDELKLSKNLLVNTHLKEKVFSNSILEFYDSNKILEYLDDNFDNIGYIEEKGLYNNNNLNNLKLNYINYFILLKNSLFYEPYLIDSNYKNLDINLYSNIKIFFSKIFIDIINNKYNMYHNSFLLDNFLILYYKLNFNNNFIRDFDIEIYLKYLYKYYIQGYRNNYKINKLNNLYINMFDASPVVTEDLWNDLKSLNDIAAKDSFNLLRHMSNNIIYLYSGEERVLNKNEYHEFRHDGTHFEEVDLPAYLNDDVLDCDDIKLLYMRYINFDKYFEVFINSFLWLSLDNSDFKFEMIDTLLFYNDILNNWKDLLYQYMHINIINYNGLESIEDYYKKNVDQLVNSTELKLLKDDKTVKQIHRRLLRILKFELFLKDKAFNNDILFCNQSNNYLNYLININNNKFNVLKQYGSYEKNFNIYNYIKNYKLIYNNYNKIKKID